MLEREMLDAFDAGAAACRTRAARIGENPHADVDTPRGRVLAAMWADGYQSELPDVAPPLPASS